MLTMVSAQNDSGTLLMPLTDASAGYAIREIQGLDPVKATLVSSAIAQKDGADLHNARREPRNITMKIGLQSNWVTNSVAGLRSSLYQWFMPKSWVTFALYEDDMFWGSILAMVESFENNMFSADPEVSISLMCYDPDFYAPASTNIVGNTVSNLTTQTITYQGTTDTGIIFTVTFPANASSISLYNTRPDKLIEIINIDGSFLAGDVLRVNTNPGQKSVIVIRSGLEIPSLYYLNRDSSWIRLQHGDNQFRAYYSGAPTQWEIEYTAKYGGY